MNDLLYIISTILILPVFIYALSASSKVKRTFKKYSTVSNQNNFTGREVARAILDKAGLEHISIETTRGSLTDHYDPRNKTVYLSESVYYSQSVSAIGVAAHEVGHAIQHNSGYSPLKIRSALVPYANIGSRLALPLLIMAFIFQGSAAMAPSIAQPIITVGLILFASSTLFTFVTLPVEFIASRRAKVILVEGGILNAEELGMASEVLNAAAKTYVAAFAMSLIQLIRLITLFNRR